MDGKRKIHERNQVTKISKIFQSRPVKTKIRPSVIVHHKNFTFK